MSAKFRSDAEFRALIRLFKKQFPCPQGRPVFVRVRPRSTILGSLMSDENNHRICISNDQHWNSAVDSLCHEWAHVLDDQTTGDSRKEEHRASWGRCYAKVYKAYLVFHEQWKKDHPDE